MQRKQEKEFSPLNQRACPDTSGGEHKRGSKHKTKQGSPPPAESPAPTNNKNQFHYYTMHFALCALSSLCHSVISLWYSV